MEMNHHLHHWKQQAFQTVHQVQWYHQQRAGRLSMIMVGNLLLFQSQPCHNFTEGLLAVGASSAESRESEFRFTTFLRGLPLWFPAWWLDPMSQGSPLSWPVSLIRRGFGCSLGLGGLSFSYRSLLAHGHDSSNI